MKFKIIGKIGEDTLWQFLFMLERAKPKEAVEITIHSQGGSGEVALSITNIIEENPKRFVVIGIGRVESAAYWIMAKAGKRVAYKDTIFMFHRPTLENSSFWERWGHKKKLGPFVRRQKELSNPIRTGARARYFTAQEVLQMGLIDEIV